MTGSGSVGFDTTKLDALATSITGSVPGLGDLDREIGTLRADARALMGGTPMPSDAGLPAPKNDEVGLGLLDISTEIRRRLGLIKTNELLKTLGFTPSVDPMALQVADQEAVDQAAALLRDVLNRDHGVNGNRDDLEELRKALEGLNPQEIDLLVDELSDDELAKLGELARNTDDGFWNPFDRNGLERFERFEFFGIFLSQVSPSRIPRIVAAFPELNPGFDTTDGALDQNSQTGESAQGMQYGVPDGEIWPLDADGQPMVEASQANQGSLGDCWFIASMLAAQGADPQFIPDHMRVNPNGTISVQMYDDDGDPHWTTMTNELPLKPDGSVAMGRGQYLWGAYYEKAFAQLYADDDGGAPDGKQGDDDYDRREVGTYGALEWDYTDNAAPYITGNDADGLGHDFDDARDAFRDGKPVLISTGSDKPDPPEEWGNAYSERHVYFIKSVTDSTITVGNPWGPNYPDITMTQEQFDDYFGDATAMDFDK